MSIPAYRITEEDLPDADKKTRRALNPLLESLNSSLTNTINVVNTTTKPDPRRVTLSTGDDVDASFPFKFSTSVANPISVEMNIIPRDAGHDLTVPFVIQGFVFISGVISIRYITGLLPNQTYDLNLVVR